MDFGHSNARLNVEGDRLSSLPDDRIHKILSYLRITDAIDTSVLSSRWRYLWTSLPYLDFSSEDFTTLPNFSKFVTHVLSRRNNLTEVYSVKLTFRGKVSQVFVKRILDYAFSHNVQQLKVTCLSGNKKTEFPFSRFSSQSLKHLTLIGYSDCIMTLPSWELPSLATLKIYRFTLNAGNNDKCHDLFSNCANLKNLSLLNCRIVGGLNVTLTLENGGNDVNVVTPQLRNLNLNYWPKKLLISAPNLSSFQYKDSYYLVDLSADFLHLEKADICISGFYESKEKARRIICLLQQIRSVKFLTLNSEFIQSLNSSVELIIHQPSPFTNLKGLKIYPYYVPEAEAEDEDEDVEQEVTMSTETKNYLLDNSSEATVTMVSHDEIREVRNVKSARSLMSNLQVLLDRWKNNSEINRTDMKQGKAPMDEQVEAEVENQPGTNMKSHFEGRMTHIKCYWENLNEQLEKGYQKTSSIIPMLEEIEGVLTKLPTSYRDKLQERLFRLCAEAETIMGNVMNRMKIQCDEKPSRSYVHFHELITSKRQS